MPPWKIHILYEYDTQVRPHASSFIRLLRPLTHPTLNADLQVTFGPRYQGQAVEAVIVDRLWRPDITPALAHDLVRAIRQAGARFVYAMDDNLFDLALERQDWPEERHLESARLFLAQADQVWVTTPALKERLAEFNPAIQVLPQALDERLFVSGSWLPPEPLFKPQRKVIGYMGTLTHDRDLLMILPALRAIVDRYPGQIEIQLIGAIGQEQTRRTLEGLPIRMLAPEPAEAEYPLFMLWFTGRVHWDLALAPLRDTPFTRGKSDIKFLDYCAIGAPGVYSRVPAYEASVRPMETGLLVDNTTEAWVAAIEQLLSDDALRVQLARNAVRYLHAERTLRQRAPAWSQALKTLLDA